MSTRELGTIQASKAKVDRTAAWVFALILAVLFTVSLIATTEPGTSVEQAPAAPAFTVGEAGAGGPSTVNRDATPERNGVAADRDQRHGLPPVPVRYPPLRTTEAGPQGPASVISVTPSTSEVRQD